MRRGVTGYRGYRDLIVNSIKRVKRFLNVEHRTSNVEHRMMKSLRSVSL
jgi:hypothetical protein